MSAFVELAFDGYIECAMWTEGDELPDDAQLSQGAFESMRADVSAFIESAGDDVDGLDAGQVGHDFWLTRNGHGAGFWDRGLGAVGQRLTALAESFGECDLYVGDDGLVELA